MIDSRKRAVEAPVLANDVSLAVDVQGRAVALGEAPKRDAFTMQLAAPILECVHRRAHPSNAPAKPQG
jgi:hypothetical protein